MTTGLVEREAELFDSRLSTPGDPDFWTEFGAVSHFLEQRLGAEGSMQCSSRLPSFRNWHSTRFEWLSDQQL